MGLLRCGELATGQLGDLGVGGEPDVAVTRDVIDQVAQHDEPRAMADDVRVQGELEQPALGVGGVELVAPDLEQRAWRRVGPQRAVALHHQVRGVVADPLHRDLDDAPYFTRTGTLPSPELIFQVYKDEFDVAYEEGGYFNLTMHPHVIGHRSRIMRLDRLIAYIKSKPGVWFTTTGEFTDYVKKNSTE